MPGVSPTEPDPMADWMPESWQGRTATQLPDYPDPRVLEDTVQRMSKLPPLVTSWEIESLRERLATAARGESFLLQGGDCAESFDDCDVGRPGSEPGERQGRRQLELGQRRPAVGLVEVDERQQVGEGRSELGGRHVLAVAGELVLEPIELGRGERAGRVPREQSRGCSTADRIRDRSPALVRSS